MNQKWMKILPWWHAFLTLTPADIFLFLHCWSGLECCSSPSGERPREQPGRRGCPGSRDASIWESHTKTWFMDTHLQCKQPRSGKLMSLLFFFVFGYWTARRPKLLYIYIFFNAEIDARKHCCWCWCCLKTT